MDAVLSYINAIRGIDFSLYRPATIRRKLDCRLQATGCEDLAAYLEFLRNRPEEVQDLISALTIKVSSFFRNTIVFEFL